MGVFSTAFAAGIVILQATLIFLNNAPTQWTFSLVQRDTHHHAVAVLAPFSPHLIIFALACMHFLICLSRAQCKRPASTTVYEFLQRVPLWAVLAALAVLTLIVGIVAFTTGGADLLRYPTILVVIVLFLGGANYVYTFSTHGDDLDWTIANHLQVVGVPLTMIVAAAMGVRYWIDLFAYTLYLSCAVNMLWLQSISTTGDHARQIGRLLAVALPTYVVVVSQPTWGVDSWQQVVTYMSALSVMPLYVLTLMWVVDNAEEAAADKLKRRGNTHRLHIAQLFVSGGLLSAVVNFAMI